MDINIISEYKEIERLRIELQITRDMLIDEIQERYEIDSRADAHATVNCRIFERMRKVGVPS